MLEKRCAQLGAIVKASASKTVEVQCQVGVTTDLGHSQHNKLEEMRYQLGDGSQVGEGLQDLLIDAINNKEEYDNKFVSLDNRVRELEVAPNEIKNISENCNNSQHNNGCA